LRSIVKLPNRTTRLQPNSAAHREWNESNSTRTDGRNTNRKNLSEIMPWIKDEDGQPILVAKDSIENKLDDFKNQRDIEIAKNSYTLKNQKTMKTSKVRGVQPNGQFKDMNVFEVSFENGDAGNNYAKGNCRFEVGKEYQYEIGGSGKTPSIKFIGEAGAPAKSFGGGGSSFQKSPQDKAEIARAVALKAAVDAIGAGEEPYKYVNCALYFEHYLTTGQQANQDAVDNALNDRKMDANNDLPF